MNLTNKLKSTLNNFEEEQIERVHLLGDSEQIIRKILKIILIRVFSITRRNYLSNLKRNIAIDHVFRQLDYIKNLGSIKCDFDLETEFHTKIEECGKPKIDPWASNTTIKNIYVENTKSNLNYITNNFKILALHNNNKKAKKLKRGPIKETNNEENSESIEVDINEKKKKNNVKNGSKFKNPVSNKKKKNDDENVPQVNLSEEMNYYQTKNKQNPSYNEEIENNLRNYLKEKENDKEMAKKFLKDEEDMLKEYEKKKRLANNPNNILILNSQGKLINVKKIDSDQLQETFLFSNYNFSQKINRNHHRTMVDHPDHKENYLNQEHHADETNILVIENTEVPVQPKQIIYNQPDPMEGFEPENGVNLNYGLKKKLGNEFKIDDRITQTVFEKIKSKINPNHWKKRELIAILNPMNSAKISEDSKLKDSKTSNQPKKLFDFNFEEDSIPLDKPLDNKNVKKNSKLTSTKSTIFDLQGKMKEKNKNFRKSHSTWNLKSQNIKGKIEAGKTFNFNDLPLLNDEKTYQEFDQNNNGNDDPLSKRYSILLPKSNHGKVMEEMGKMKKYPRERIPHEILAISHKNSNLPIREKADKLKVIKVNNIK